jgi:hypothetical protein
MPFDFNIELTFKHTRLCSLFNGSAKGCRSLGGGWGGGWWGALPSGILSKKQCPHRRHMLLYALKVARGGWVPAPHFPPTSTPNPPPTRLPKGGGMGEWCPLPPDPPTPPSHPHTRRGVGGFPIGCQDIPNAKATTPCSSALPSVCLLVCLPVCLSVCLLATKFQSATCFV